MKEKLEEAVKILAEKAKKTDKAVDALQFSQAALNAMNALACLNNQK